MPLLDDNFGGDLLIDPNFFGDNSMDEPWAAFESHSSPVPNLLDAKEGMGDSNGMFSPQSNFNEFRPTNRISQYQTIYPSFQPVGEDYTTFETTTTPSDRSSSNTALSPTDQLLLVSSPTFMNCQLLEMSFRDGGLPESYDRYMSITPMNSPESPTNVQKPRGRKRKNLEMLKRDERKVCRPEKCHICGLGHAQRRELERHMVSNHRKEAERMELDVSKVSCKFCGLKFDRIRRDRLVRHMKRKHPNSL